VFLVSLVRSHKSHERALLVVRLAKNTLSDKDAIVSSFEESFTKLKDNFRAGIDVKVVIVVLDMQQKLSDIQTTLGSLGSSLYRV
jgi:hypothetical protein